MLLTVTSFSLHQTHRSPLFGAVCIGRPHGSSRTYRLTKVCFYLEFGDSLSPRKILGSVVAVVEISVQFKSSNNAEDTGFIFDTASAA